MRSFGYIFILLGMAAVRQVAVGRVGNIPEDVADLFNALTSGDVSKVGDVTSRRGSNVAVGSGEVATTENPTATPPTSDGSLVGEMQKLGDATKSAAHPNGWYVWGAVGPNSYDCSGLVWRACKNLGLYSGPRFTTSTFSSIANGWATQVKLPARGDIVLWAGKHIGVTTGPDGLYSARSEAKGIGPSTVSGDSSSLGTPTYWRVNA